MYYGYLPSFNLEHDNFAHPDWFFLVIRQKQEISTEECRLHAPTGDTNTKK